MSCHYAGQTLKMLSYLLLVLCVIHLIISDAKVQCGLDAGIAAVSIALMRIPGSVIPICGKPEMLCRRMTQPWTIALAAVILLICAADLFVSLSEESAKKHRRPQ